jgi:RNase P protein component
MISKQHKLTTKEVNYLMRRKQSVYVDGYKILHCEQYPNNLYHQTGIQVSGKIHKHAVQRNIIRRAYYAAREDQIDKAVHNRYHKVFLVIHPEHCEKINNTIESGKLSKVVKDSENKWQKQVHSKLHTHQQLKQHFNSIIISALWKINQAASKTWSQRQSYSGVSSQPNPKQ